MADAETWTIGRLLDWTKNFLEEHGSDTARLDAEVLLAFARQCPRIQLYTAYKETAEDSLRQSFRELVLKRAKGTPVAYLVGDREFYSLSFKVTPDVLIPRPETEHLVIRMLDLAKEHFPQGSVSVADVGTGSGILAVCAAKYMKDASVLALDISPPALEVAAENAEQHHVREQITFLESDLLSSVAPEEQFDFIVSNPPYVSESEFTELDTSVKDHEPKLALVGGPTGTELIKQLVHQAQARLRSGGWLLMEFSPMIADQVRNIINATNDFDEVTITNDLAKLPRIIEARRS